LNSSAALGFDPHGPAADLFKGSVNAILPAVILKDSDGHNWHPQRDLLASGPFDRNFVVETEDDAAVYLRFGDDHHGLRPNEDLEFHADYRVGNAIQGNIGFDTLAHITIADTSIIRVWNPLPAWGGREPESIEQVRRLAPVAFRQQERAVTAEDYAAMAEHYPGVQKAAATLRWTGSWYTVFLVIDRICGLPVDQDFEDEVRRYMEKYRMAGHDLEVEGPRFVPLEIDLLVCVAPEHFRSDVKQDLLRVFSSADLPDGRTGLFHPDRFTFGQPVYLSVIVAAAQAVDGVAGVRRITTFQRQGKPETDARASGPLLLQRFEIARLDNDPNFPDRGVFRLELEGGK
jgi:predicted phage baseplate assembly protein